MPAVEFRKVDVIFGDRQEAALGLLDAGKSRDEILAETGSVVGVTDASIAVEEGEICVLMGLSGSGKSSLLRCVNGLNTVTRGSVLVDDAAGEVDVADCDPVTLRRLRMNRVAMVFQQFALLPWRTVRENVGFGLELRGLAQAERDAVVTEKLELVGLAQWADKYAHELSGGMQQRVGLARAFATDADILLMDEPFSALDPLIRSRLQDELLDLQRSLKKTIIFVSHDLDEALKIGSHIAIMESGRIVQYGRPEEIVLAPASQYVADFVANMNPLNVLSGSTLMTAVDAIARDGGLLRLDWSGRTLLALDADGRPQSAQVDGGDGRLVPFAEGADPAKLSQAEVATATPGISMRLALELRHRTGCPVVLVDGEGRMVGVVGDVELYSGLLRQASIAAAPAGA